MDPLSHLFLLLGLDALACARFEAGGDWAVRFPAQAHIKFGAALRGSYWLAVGDAAPVRIAAGDTYLLADCPAYVIASDCALPAVDGVALYEAADAMTVRHGGDDIAILGGSFTFDAANAALVMAMLPPLMVIPAGDAAAPVLRATLGLLEQELHAEMPGQSRMGTSLMANRLGDILLLQALRAVADEAVPPPTSEPSDGAPAGWLGALGHAKLGKALRAMHANLRHPWQVGELATLAGMSRADFARKFKQRVGVPPLDYLTSWRMHLARRTLHGGSASVADAAQAAGYASESAFANAFKRVFGQPPSRYRAAAALAGRAL